ncbi:MAG TPA: hypothetical protein VGE29_11020 [Prosthecobacter sp.]
MPPPPPTVEEREQFTLHGVLRLKGRLSRKVTEAARQHIHTELERLKLKTNGKLTAARIADLPLFQQTTRLGQMIPPGPWMDPLFPPDLLAFMNTVGTLGQRNLHPAPQAQLLLSLPHKKEWALAGLNWHLDVAVPRRDECPGVQAFVLIDEVRPHGGATLALTGSHRLPYAEPPQNPPVSAQAALRQHPAFAPLFEGSLSAEPGPGLEKPQVVNGIPVSLFEMSGQAGDVFLMDMRLLHTPSINATPYLRMMATLRLPRG